MNPRGGVISQLYGSSLALLTDLYELTMAYGYWKLGMADTEAVFHLSYRRQPFGGGIAIACGLHDVIEYLSRLRFEASDLEYLATLKGNDGNALFDSAFLDYLARFEFAYNTLEGVRHAARVGRDLHTAGHEMQGVRLDSGDLAYLSIEARKILDEAGLYDAKILATNDLDERIIESLKQQGAKIAVWGVGTKLATAHDDPALGGVYKLAAIRDRDGKWEYKIKISEQTAKLSVPGILQVRRFRGADGLFSADAIYDVDRGIESPTTIIDPSDAARRKVVAADCKFEDLLVPVFRRGSVVYQRPDLEDVRRRTSSQIAPLHPSIKRFVNPHRYPAGLESRLYEMRHQLAQRARRGTGF